MKDLFIKIIHEEELPAMSLLDIVGGADLKGGDNSDCLVFFCSTYTQECPGNMQT